MRFFYYGSLHNNIIADSVLYNKMQEWREWSGDFAKLVMEKLEKSVK